ncbi:MAG: hypothetical protein ACHQQQ_01780 [Bacteroidota bacterium]
MSKIIICYLGVLLIGFSILNIGCQTKIDRRLNCICLIDYSGSLSDETLQRYIHIISSDVLSNLNIKDRLIVLPIDEGAKTEAVKLVYEDFSEKKYSKTSDGFTHASDSTMKRFHDYLEQLKPQLMIQLDSQKVVRSKFTYFTDIMAALEQSEGLLETNEEDNFTTIFNRFITGRNKLVSENVIILFSDMIHESSEYNFNKPNGCDSKEASSIINNLVQNKRMPNLKGSKIFVDGRTGHSNRMVENIRSFWSKYFKESHADLIAYDFDIGNQIVSFLNNQRVK